MSRALGNSLLVTVALTLSGRAPLAAQTPTAASADAWRGAIAVTVGVPGAFGLLLEGRPFPILALRGVVRGTWGDVPRGGGLGLALLHGSEGRLYVSASGGIVRCFGDRDGVCSGHPRETSAAFAIGLGGEFPVSTSKAVAIGIEVERWFTVSGPYPAVNVAVFSFRYHWTP